MLFTSQNFGAGPPTRLLSMDELDALKHLFEKNGFIGPIKLYEPEKANEMLHQIRLDNQIRSAAIFDNDVNYDRHFDIPVLAKHIMHRRIAQIVSHLLAEDLFCWRTEFFPKFPNSAGTEWHQVVDYSYATGQAMLEPGTALRRSTLDMTVWTSFTPSTKETACMKFLPGSHRHRYYDERKNISAGRHEDYRSVEAGTAFYGYEFQDFKINPEWMPDESKAVAMEMNAGECVMFSASCVHASYPNVSKRQTRFAISARYVPTDIKVYPGWRGFKAHGGIFDLSRYGCVLVHGEDRYGFNRVRQTDEYGQPFCLESI
jgi:non-haem Fe2+, alpha-ketoglutarate-dependent halogenase